ncbi:NAD(P)-binding protein [Gonapodya prolifera JEL478]|uniref:NAD(P)-binding protein n=1 Tax=Gonapodya prolifera (strain JEL478) TaxID=1344416 RepID=A0A139ALI3_GONPJ|nr:NAD(P)-binding protein [Gonapodya prolifera JEL478]|eukprot:KXS17404.1 NAD(P)-binding protein [Gonapodya prolifera JEL478]
MLIRSIAILLAAITIAIYMSKTAENVAIAGNGPFAVIIADALKKVGFNVWLVGRKVKESTGGYETKLVPEWTEDGLVEAVKGAKYVVIALGFLALKEPQFSVIKAAKRAGASAVVLSEFGVPLEFENPVAAGKWPARNLAKETGIDWIGLSNGFFLDYPIGKAAINEEKSTAFVYGDPNTKFTVTARDDVAAYLAQILLRPDEFKNRETQVTGAITSYAELYALVGKVRGVTYTINTEPLEVAKEKLAANPADIGRRWGVIVASGQNLNPRDESHKFPEVKPKGLDYWIPKTFKP